MSPEALVVYALRPPAPELAPYIEHYWCVRATPERPLDLTVDVYVDARADLVLNFGAPYVRTVMGGGARVIAESNVDAQRLTPIRIAQAGLVVTSGVRFHAGGLSAVVGMSVDRWNDKIVPLAEAFGPEVVRLEADVRLAIDDLDAQKRCLDAFFARRLRPSAGRRLFEGVKAEIERRAGAARIEDLCREHRASTRQLGRLFRTHLGFGPKLFCRIVRFRNALERLKHDPGCTLAEVAAECGYYDQPHFVRECKAFAGEVPKRQVGYFPSDAPTDFSPNLVRFVQDAGGE